jgi:hypothetical protein
MNAIIEREGARNVTTDGIDGAAVGERIAFARRVEGSSRRISRVG